MMETPPKKYPSFGKPQPYIISYNPKLSAAQELEQAVEQLPAGPVAAGQGAYSIRAGGGRQPSHM